MSEYQVIGTIIGAFVLAGVLSYVLTPVVKRFAYTIGAIDVPKDNRRMHKRVSRTDPEAGHMKRPEKPEGQY